MLVKLDEKRDRKFNLHGTSTTFFRLNSWKLRSNFSRASWRRLCTSASLKFSVLSFLLLDESDITNYLFSKKSINLKKQKRQKEN